MRSVIHTASVDLHTHRQGSEARTVFVHGFGDDLHTWDRVWEELGGNFGALRYDLRGFGSSLCRGVPFRHSEDLLALLDAANLDRCNVVGVSDGGSIALNFTLDHPERVRRLILINPGLVAWEWSAEWKILWQRIVVCARAGRLSEAKRLWWEHPLFGTTRASDAAELLLKSVARFPGQQWIRDHQIPQLPDVDRLYLLETPTLLLTGGRDLQDFRLIADLIAASAPGVQRVDLPAGGHLLHLEAPKECAQSMRSFLCQDFPGR